MTTCHRLVKFLILCTRSPVLVFFRRSVSSRHSAEKRNPECSHRISRLCIIYWIPLFSGMTTCHRLVKFLILCTRSPVLVFFRRSVSSRHSAEKRNPECSHRISRLCIIYWIPLFSGMTTCHRLVKFLILCTRSPVLVFFRRSVSSRHSAEKRNPECNHRINCLCIIYWIPLFQRNDGLTPSGGKRQEPMGRRTATRNAANGAMVGRVLHRKTQPFATRWLSGGYGADCKSAQTKIQIRPNKDANPSRQRCRSVKAKMQIRQSKNADPP